MARSGRRGRGDRVTTMTGAALEAAAQMPPNVVTPVAAMPVVRPPPIATIAPPVVTMPAAPGMPGATAMGTADAPLASPTVNRNHLPTAIDDGRRSNRQRTGAGRMSEEQQGRHRDRQRAKESFHALVPAMTRP